MLLWTAIRHTRCCPGPCALCVHGPSRAARRLAYVFACLLCRLSSAPAGTGQVFCQSAPAAPHVTLPMPSQTASGASAPSMPACSSSCRCHFKQGHRDDMQGLYSVVRGWHSCAGTDSLHPRQSRRCRAAPSKVLRGNCTAEVRAQSDSNSPRRLPLHKHGLRPNLRNVRASARRNADCKHTVRNRSEEAVS